MYNKIFWNNIQYIFLVWLLGALFQSNPNCSETSEDKDNSTVRHIPTLLESFCFVQIGVSILAIQIWDSPVTVVY